MSLELFKRTDFVDAVNKELERLMRENPDFVYADPDKPNRGCRYDSGPVGDEDRCDGCIFGQAFQSLGVTKSEMNIDDVRFQFPIDELVYEFGITTIPDCWSAIQHMQDAGVPWGELRQAMEQQSS